MYRTKCNVIQSIIHYTWAYQNTMLPDVQTCTADSVKQRKPKEVIINNWMMSLMTHPLPHPCLLVHPRPQMDEEYKHYQNTMFLYNETIKCKSSLGQVYLPLPWIWFKYIFKIWCIENMLGKSCSSLAQTTEWKKSYT